MTIQLSMYEYFKSNRRNHDIPAMNYYGRDISYGEFNLEIDKIASYLVNLGINNDDCVAICLPNFPSAVATFYAVNKIGAIANIIHPLMPPKGLLNILKEIKCKALFVYDYFYPDYKEVLRGLDIPIIACGAYEHMSGVGRLALRVAMAFRCGNLGDNALRYNTIMKMPYTATNSYKQPKIGEKIACYLHSGGTTGTPKTVMMSNRALNSCSKNIISLIGKEFEEGDKMLMVLPMFHVFGLGVCMHSAISNSATSVLVPRFNARAISKLVPKVGLTYMTGVPSMYEKLLNEESFDGAKLASLKYCYCGGDKLKQDIIDRFTERMTMSKVRCQLCEGYGLTEATITNVNSPQNRRQGSVGQPIGDCLAGVFDSNGKRLENNQRGEIYIGGTSVMSGYYNDSETTNKVLIVDNDGVTWVKTGDIGRIDESGHLYFIDRKKRMLKISGMNVFPAEIESVVYDRIDEVEKCCAVEIIIEEKAQLKLIVVLKDKISLDICIENKIKYEIGTRLMKYSIPKYIEARDSLPLTQIGKVDYKAIEKSEKVSNKTGDFAN